MKTCGAADLPFVPKTPQTILDLVKGSPSKLIFDRYIRIVSDEQTKITDLEREVDDWCQVGESLCLSYVGKARRLTER